MKIKDAVKAVWLASGMDTASFAKSVGWNHGSSVSSVTTGRNRPRSRIISNLREAAQKYLSGKELVEVDECFANYQAVLAGRAYMRHYRAPRTVVYRAIKAPKTVENVVSKLSKKRLYLVGVLSQAQAALDNFDAEISKLAE